MTTSIDDSYRCVVWAAPVLVAALCVSPAGCVASDPMGQADQGSDEAGSGSDTSTGSSTGTSSSTSSTAPDTGSETDTGTDTGTDTDGPPDLCDDTSGFTNPEPGALGHSQIAHWKYDRAAALTINFDDSTPGQAQVGVPAMIEHGFTGTWFVNPNRQAYMDNLDTWENVAPNNFQELANHSMDHAGAMDYADAEYQIGMAAQIIRSVYPPERSPMMAFNNGGGTTWNVTDVEYQQLLDQYFCEERLYSSGVAPATPGQKIFTDLKAYMQAEIPADNWTNMHFHGLCDPADLVNCVCDTPDQTSNCREYGVSGVNNGAVMATEFEFFLDQLSADPYYTEQVWIAGFISAYKYQQERPAAQAVLESASETQLNLCLESALDPALFDEPLTVITEAPDGWSGCAVTQAGEAGSCRIVGSTAVFEARSGAGVISISPL